uniref:Secreted protein n=1 Tax=Arundo donax TaxID=35708 RepID=A0A0A9H0P1_ARUDO
MNWSITTFALASFFSLPTLSHLKSFHKLDGTMCLNNTASSTSFVARPNTGMGDDTDKQSRSAANTVEYEISRESLMKTPSSSISNPCLAMWSR